MTHKQQPNATKLSLFEVFHWQSLSLSSTPNNGGYEVPNSMSIERSLVLSNGTTTFTFSLHDHTSESLPLSESVSSSVSSSLVSLSWKKKTDKTRLNGSLNHSQHLHHHHHIHTSSSEDSVALLALYFFCKSEVFLFHTCKQTPSSSSLSSPPPHQKTQLLSWPRPLRHDEPSSLCKAQAPPCSVP